MQHLMDAVRKFARERDWEQFHTPKNLAAALTVEASELLEIFQWMTPEESDHPSEQDLERIRDEIGDVLIYLARLSDRLTIDPLAAAKAKLEKNRERYKVETSRGVATKHRRPEGVGR